MGAVAYLSHSVYGINDEIRINNNSTFLTGYSVTSEPTLEYPDYKGYGTSSSVTQAYNTTVGYLASTTGNITGIYDMSGGLWEYMMGVQVDANELPLSGRHNIYNSGFNGTLGCPTCDIGTVSGVDSGITSITNGINLPESKYYDSYKVNSNGNKTNRILGDATGEMGSFGIVQTIGTIAECGMNGICDRAIGSWYNDNSWFIDLGQPWFWRGGSYHNGTGSGIFCFSSGNGNINITSFHLTLAF